MTDYMWNKQAGTPLDELEAVAGIDFQICMNADANNEEPCQTAFAPNGTHTFNLRQLRALLERDDFNRLEETLSRHIADTHCSDTHGSQSNVPVAIPRPHLTGREQEIMQLIARGYRSQEMGELLEISTHTVTAHIKNLYRKLSVGSRSEAIFEAFQQGYLQH